MQSINIKNYYNKLEFDKILDQVASYAMSESGKAALLELTYCKEFEKVKEALDILKELLAHYRSDDRKIKSEIIYNFKKDIELSQKGSVLESKKLYDVANSIKYYFYLFKLIHNNDKMTTLKKMFTVDRLSDDVYTKILKYIDAEGYVESSASSELREIRDNIAKIEEKIVSSLNNYLNQLKKSNYSTFDSITYRDGLPCVAVKSNYKNSVEGIVLDSSQTGQTVYIIPKIVLELNGELKNYREKEAEELYKIRKEYTERLLSDYYSLLTIDDELIQFDIVNSKSRWSIAHNANSPDITDVKGLRILNGRHPFLGDKAVPLNLDIGEDYNILVITGPNTGGKTVVLKTVGLFCLMAQSGIGIPADADSKFFVFQEIFADIGDSQSIQDSLSTYSGHIKNIINILNNSGKDSLILIDEMGTGTDPNEGEALAVSIIKYIKANKSLALITSHFNGLKYFANQEDLIKNAAMEFDDALLKPTYKLKIGSSGSSKAFEIAAQLGMPASILNEAKLIINKGYLQIEKLIDSLNSEKKALEDKSYEIEKTKEAVETMKEELDKKIKDIDLKDKELKKIIFDKKYDFLKESRKEFENIIKEIKTSDASKDAIKSGKDFFDKLEKDGSVSDLNDAPANPQTFKAGSSVKIISKDVKGKIIRIENKQDKYLVQTGTLKMIVEADDLKLSGDEKKEYQNKNVNHNVSASSKSMTLDLRGYKCVEAEPKLDKFLEDSLLNNFADVRIIHGMGAGALRNFVHNYLKNNPLAKGFAY
ncbi:MAG TPA: endonuclease MutS2, partial [Spirochaetota bacterium]|nr:endonuclease MutS2 [Spirochaetota bacterium]